MSTWVVGATYDYYGTPIRCVARYFAGALELVDLCHAAASECQPKPFTRTARTLAPCVHPRVTETLGGVYSPAMCRHDIGGRVTANAGPFVGRECCELCGIPPQLNQPIPDHDGVILYREYETR